MAQDLSNFRGVIEFALEKEAEARALYENLAKQTTSNRDATIFKELAAAEAKHYETLDKLDFQVVEKVSKKPVPDLKLSEQLQDVSFSEDMSYQDILILAIKNEEHSHSLYQGLANHVDDAGLTKIFEFLASQEARHKLRLETEYDDYILTED